jgi:hypothetical protein
MLYTEYVKFLKNYKINLFDYQYRISYNEIFNNYKFNQNGGGDKNYNVLNNKSIEDIKMIVNISLSSNPQYISLLL